MDHYQSQPEYFEYEDNPENQKTQTKLVIKESFHQFCYEDQRLNFTALSLNKQSVLEIIVGSHYPKRKYLSVYRGLNIKGTCQNKDCIGYHKNVWIRKGYGKISFGQTRFGNDCPCCGKAMLSQSFKTLGFRNAKLIFEGGRVMNGKEQKFHKQEEQRNGKFIKFTDYDEDTCEWIYLNITVYEI